MNTLNRNKIEALCRVALPTAITVYQHHEPMVVLAKPGRYQAVPVSKATPEQMEQAIGTYDCQQNAIDITAAIVRDSIEVTPW